MVGTCDVKLLATYALALFGTAGCGGGGSDADAFCAALGGGSASVSASPEPGSAFDSPAAVFDGDLGTYASLTVPAAGGGSIRGTAQAGTVAAGGEVAGILLSVPDNGSYTISINTYVEGEPVDSGVAATFSYANGSPVSQSCAGTCVTRNGVSFVGVSTTAPFDAIEAVLSVNGATAAIELRELCID